MEDSTLIKELHKLVLDKQVGRNDLREDNSITAVNVDKSNY